MDLVEFSDDDTNDGTALFKTTEAFSGISSSQPAWR